MEDNKEFSPPFAHISVMPQEVMTYLDLQPGQTVVDVTAGKGGHLALIAQAVGYSGLAVGLDRDERALMPDAAGAVASEFSQVKLVHASYSELKIVLAQLGIEKIDGLLCDLGVSSHQLDTAERGFSFNREGLLDMRMDQSRGITAYQLLGQLDEKSLANLIFEYGDERFSRRIAKVIKEAWPLENSTLALAKLIERAVRRSGKIHSATRTFQALRIAVNRELLELDTLLALLPEIMAPQGKAVFISFHSTEDRKIKLAFKEMAMKIDKKEVNWRIITKKPAVPSREEVISNRRARSAKVRCIQKL